MGRHVGGAIVADGEGMLADHAGIQHIFLLPAICYSYILYGVLRGSRPAHLLRA
jgi:fucose permease